MGVSAHISIVLLEVENKKEFVIKLLRHNDQENSFSERFAKYKNVSFEYVDSYESAVKGSDVVISGVTYAPEDFCSDDAFDKGVLVVPIHTLGFTNCDLLFDKVFGDDYGHVCGFKNFSKFKSFAEMTDVVNGKVPGRENDKERILAYNVGVSTHDINFAAHIYQMLQADNLMDFDMKAPTEKFWI